VGQRVGDLVRVGDEHTLPVLVDDVRGHADDGGVRRDIAHHHRSGPNARVLADDDIAEDVRIVADEYAVAQRRVALAGLLAGTAKRYALVEGHIVAHDCRFADHDTQPMIDEEATADACARMYLHAGKEPRDLRKQPGPELPSCAPQTVLHTVPP